MPFCLRPRPRPSWPEEYGPGAACHASSRGNRRRWPCRFLSVIRRLIWRGAFRRPPVAAGLLISALLASRLCCSRPGEDAQCISISVEASFGRYRLLRSALSRDSRSTPAFHCFGCCCYDAWAQASAGGWPVSRPRSPRPDFPGVSPLRSHTAPVATSAKDDA